MTQEPGQRHDGDQHEQDQSRAVSKQAVEGHEHVGQNYQGVCHERPGRPVNIQTQTQQVASTEQGNDEEQPAGQSLQVRGTGGCL